MSVSPHVGLSVPCFSESLSFAILRHQNPVGERRLLANYVSGLVFLNQSFILISISLTKGYIRQSESRSAIRVATDEQLKAISTVLTRCSFSLSFCCAFFCFLTGVRSAFIFCLLSVCRDDCPFRVCQNR